MKSTMIHMTLATVLGAALTSAHAEDKPAAPKLSDDKVRIGVLTDMSGVYSSLTGQGSVIAAEMAVEDYIAKYKPKFKIEVIYADHQNKPDIAAGKAREWYDTQGVDMITDVVNSAVGIAVSKLTREKNRVMMNVSSVTSRMSNEECSPNTINYGYDTYSLSNSLGKAITKAGGNSWFFISADYAFGQTLEKDTSEAVKTAGGKVLGAARHPLNASDFSSFMLQAQASKAKVVGLANAGGDAINAIKAANEFGLTKDQTVVGLLLSIIDVHAMGLQATQGMMFIDGFYWDRTPETREWSRRFFLRNKRMPAMPQAAVYSSVLHYLKAVQSAGSDEAGAVLSKMKTTPVNDIYASNAKIREDNRLLEDVFLVQVKKPTESKEPWDYFNVKAVIPGEQAFQPLALSRCPMVKKQN